MADPGASPSCSSESVGKGSGERQIVSIAPDGTKMVFQTKEERKEFYRQQAELPEPHATHRRVMKEVWLDNSIQKEDRLQILAEITHQIVAQAANPFVAVLDLHRHCCDYVTKKENSLAGSILTFFDEWCKKRDDTEQLYEKYLTPEIKQEAFRVATAKHTGCLKKMCEIFRLNEDPDMEEFVQKEISRLCQSLMFKEAMDVVEFYKWQDSYHLTEFAIPCMLQGKISLVEDYLGGHPNLQIKFIKWMDDLIPMKNIELEEDVFKPYVQKKIMTVPVAHFQEKTLQKTVNRLLSKFGFVAAIQAPNLAEVRAQGHIKYQTSQRFEMQKISEQTYFDAVYNSVKSNKKLQHWMNGWLCYKGRPETALWWSEYFNLPDYDRARGVRAYEENNPMEAQKMRDEVEAWRHRPQASESKETLEGIELVTDYPIVIVDSKEAVVKLGDHLRTQSVIGIDAEWKPQYASTIDQVALMQIATAEAVYLVDFFVLQKDEILSIDEWRVFLEALLTGEAVKLGFDFVNDLRSIFATIPECTEVKEKCNRVVCLKMLTDNLLNHDEDLIDLTDPSKPTIQTPLRVVDGEQVPIERSFPLSLLYRNVVGKELDKSQQSSDWIFRPLRREQVLYAALDAYCLIEIYYEIVKRMDDHEYELEPFLACSDPSKPKEKKKKVKVAKLGDEEAMKKLIEEMNDVTKDAVNWKSACEFKVIVDSMLFGLGRHLRRIGVDVILAESKKELQDWALKEKDRVVLSVGKSYRGLATCEWAKGRLLCVSNYQNSTPVSQTAEIFKEFKVQPREEDIFSRCMKCNAPAFVLVPGPVLEYCFRFTVELGSIYGRPEDFDIEKWKTRLSHLPEEEFGGVGCTVDFIDPPHEIVAHCINGEIDMGSGLVCCAFLDEAVEIGVKNIPVDIFTRPGAFFYVCGSCGKVYWDGSHLNKYSETFRAVIEDIGNLSIDNSNQ